MTEKPLWGGRFGSDPAADLLRLTASIDVDMQLLPFDLEVTRAHARALEKAGLIGADEVAAVDLATEEILDQTMTGELRPEPTDEDVHTFVERHLTRLVGDTGRRIHAGRSRNDLVATDLRLWCRASAHHLEQDVGRLVATLVATARGHMDTVMPGYTHLQRAQPVSLAFHLAAHGFALHRDGTRFRAAAEAADVSALGAGALAGTTLDIDPSIAATELGFSGVYDNAMDAVSDRDFAVDLVYASALCCVHLSRLAEEIVLWTTAEFAFARLDDAWSTGSSMMPQKRNPDVAELIRGRAAPSIGELTALLTLVKGLPLAYDRDLQEDKALVFRTVERTRGCLEGMTRLIESLTFDPESMDEAARAGASWATDLAEVLVARGLPFREAHEVVGASVQELEASGRGLTALTVHNLTGIHPLLQPEDVQVLDPLHGLRARAGRGGPAPDRVAEQLSRLQRAAEELMG